MGENFGEIVVYDAPEWAKVLNKKEACLHLIQRKNIIFFYFPYSQLICINDPKNINLFKQDWQRGYF